MRLGFSVRVLGRRGLRAYDGRRPQQAPHLSVSLAHLRDVLRYLHDRQIGFYRLSPELAPFSTHPDRPAFHHQIEECTAELAAIGDLARRQGVRLTIHAPLHVQLASPDYAVADRSLIELEHQAALLVAMRLDANAVIVTHIGSVLDGPHRVIERWLRRFDRLSDAARGRIVVEHEDDGASLGLALRIHAATGVPLVFDHLHFLLNNPERWSMAEALSVALATWPPDRTPKLHFSSPRTELRVTARDEPGKHRRWVLSPPRPGHHADFINPFEFAGFVRAAVVERNFDVMLEAKAGDLALLRLRHDLQRYTPDLAALLDLPLVTPESAEAAP